MNSDSLQSAFSATYEAESDAIFRFCLLRISNRDQALDLTQETFLRLWQTMQKGETMTNIRSFIFTVAHNLIIDWYRRKKPLSLESLFEGEDVGQYNMPEIMDKSDTALEVEGKHVVEAINRLNPTYRHSVYLRFVEGLSPPEIGNIIGISANTASVRINRGLEELRNILGYRHEKVMDERKVENQKDRES